MTIFPVLGKLTHINKYLFRQNSSCSTSESMDPGCDLIKFFVKVYLFGLQTAELKRSRGTAFELKDDKKSPFRIFFNMTNKHSDFFWAPFSILCFVIGLRLGICRDRRSCKIFVSCVNLSRKQRSFLHILQVYTHLNVNFLHNC